MSDLRVLAPLQDFRWAGEDIELSSGVWIRRVSTQPDLGGLDTSLAKSERDNVFRARHWLIFDWSEKSALSPAEAVNLALLSLWLIKATRTHVAFRFELDHGPTPIGKSFYRLLDRFSWISGTASEDFGSTELH